MGSIGLNNSQMILSLFPIIICVQHFWGCFRLKMRRFFQMDMLPSSPFVVFFILLREGGCYDTGEGFHHHVGAWTNPWWFAIESCRIREQWVSLHSFMFDMAWHDIWKLGWLVALNAFGECYGNSVWKDLKKLPRNFGTRSLWGRIRVPKTNLKWLHNPIFDIVWQLVWLVGVTSYLQLHNRVWVSVLYEGHTWEYLLVFLRHVQMTKTTP